MNGFDLTEYWKPAAQNLSRLGALYPSYNSWGLYSKLGDALGIKEYDDFLGRANHLDFPISDELKQLLIMLTGPHAVTILKAYRIQKGLELEEKSHLKD